MLDSRPIQSVDNDDGQEKCVGRVTKLVSRVNNNDREGDTDESTDEAHD